MRKEFVIKRIDASPDGAPYVIVSLTSSKDLQEGNKNPSQFDPSKMMDPAKMGDIVKDLNKMLSGMGGMMAGGGTSSKLDMHEYKEMNLSVGDKVYLDLTKGFKVINCNPEAYLRTWSLGHDLILKPFLGS